MNNPEMAEEWEKHTPKGKKLPKKVKKESTEDEDIINVIAEFTPEDLY